MVVTALALALTASAAYRVQLTPDDGNRIIELTPEHYIAGVVAGESGILKNPEALKAIAVAARTFALRTRGRHQTQGFDFCSTTHCQRFLFNASNIRAVQDTHDEVLYWQNQPAYTPYAQDCGGLTEADPHGPYLNVHPDPFCTRAGEHDWSWNVTPDQLKTALAKSNLQTPSPLLGLRIQRRTTGDRAALLQLQGTQSTAPIDAAAFRLAVGRALGWNSLRSDYYLIQSQAGRIQFHGKGRGHGIGLCQLGADEMGREGHSYRQILAFYYPGTTLSPASPPPHWKRLGGEGVALFTTKPAQDEKVLAQAERMLPAIQTHLNIQHLAEISIYIYPDMESFRSNTKEPGWVAAHTQGTRIDIQPAAILENRGILTATLRHEVLHAAVESQAAPNIPLWFREGLVEYLDHRQNTTATAEASDNALRQRRDESNARHAYVNAEQQVAKLINTYGETAVLSWLPRGLPAEVRNSSASRPPTNNR